MSPYTWRIWRVLISLIFHGNYEKREILENFGKFWPQFKGLKTRFLGSNLPWFWGKKRLNFESIFGKLIVYFLGNFSRIDEWFLAVVITQFLRQLLTDGDVIFIRPRVYMELYWRKIDAYFWYSNGLIFSSFLLQIDAFLRVKNEVISEVKLSSF